MATKERQRSFDTTPRRTPPKRVLNVSSVILLVIGVFSGVVAFLLTEKSDASALVMIPSVVAATTGVLNITTIKGAR